MLSLTIIAIVGLAIAIVYRKRRHRQTEQECVELYDMPIEPTKSASQIEETCKKDLQYNNVAYELKYKLLH